MTAAEWQVVIRTYNALWPNGPLAKADAWDVWYRKLGHHPQQRILDALSTLADTAVYPPLVAEITELVRSTIRRESLERPALPAGEVTPGMIVWHQITPEQRRECVELALADAPEDIAKAMGWTVDEPGPMLLVGARYHALRLYGAAA